MRPTISFLMLFCVLIYSCKNESSSIEKDPVQQDLLLKYLNQYSPRYISVKDGITVSFKREYTGDRAGTTVEGVKVKPFVEGIYTWVNASTLSFEPSEKLDYDKTYQLIIDLPELLRSDDIDDDQLTVSFNTAPLHLQTKLGGMKIAQLNGAENITYKGTIHSSDYVEEAVIESLFKATQEGERLEVVWFHQKNGKVHDFEVQGIKQFEEDSQLIIDWNGGRIKPQYKGQEMIDVSPQDVFELISVQLSASPEKIIKASFTRPIDFNQRLNGLVSIDDEDEDLKTEVEGNIIYIYPTQSLKEEFSLYLSDNIRSAQGKRLGKEQLITKLRFELEKPAVRTIGNGMILPQSVASIFPIETMNLKYVDVEIFKIYNNNILQYLQENKLNQGYYLDQVGKVVYAGKVDLSKYTGDIEENKWIRVGLNLNELINADLGAIYQIRVGYQYAYAMTNCESKISERDISAKDGRSIMDYRDDYYNNYQGRSNPCESSYYNPERFIRRNLLSSDVGVIVKKSPDHSYHLALTSLSTGSPLSEANVYLYDYQQQLIEKSFSSNSGLMSIKADERVSFVVVEHNDGYAYVKLNDEESNSLTDFDVSGVKADGGVNAFLYTDRGVHRPGDTIFLNAMISTGDESLPTGHPVKLTIKDPKGTEKFSTVKVSNVGGIYDFIIDTDPKDITGLWLAELSVGPKKFRKNLRVESIKPNRLKVNLDLPKEIDYAIPTERHINVSSTWLHGAPAADLAIEVDADFYNIAPNKGEYTGYSFKDPARTGSTGLIKLYQGKLDDAGLGSFKLKLEKDLFPGKIRANLKTRVFEKGGGFSENYSSVQISPFADYVGVKSPKSRWGSNSIKIGEDATFTMACVDKDGNKVGKRKLSIGLYDINWRWWYYQGDRYNIYRLNSAEHKSAFFSETVTTDANGRFDFTYDFQDVEYGRKMIRVCDLESGHCTGDFFYARGWGASIQEEERNSLARLNFSSDKAAYDLGDEVQITIPSEAGSKILLSIESGSKVLHQEWIEGAAKETKYRFTAHEEMAPNVYVHAIMIQSYDKKNNDLPIRMYGVIPIEVNNPATELKPLISMKDKLAPEEDFTVEISEADNAEMSYTIAIVDEGLLDLTNFSTPDPHEFFYAKQAHGITTWDLYNYVLTGYSGAVDRMISVGGDGENEEGSGAKKAMRFKPVVMTAGPFQLNRGEKKKHQFMMPNYIGSVRAMVVAKQDDAYGHADVTAPVIKPVMILPTLPRVVSPGEKIKVPVTVFVMEESVNKVDVSVKTSANISIIGDKSKSLSFNGRGEKMVYFDAIVNEELGIANFDFQGSGGAHRVSQQIEMDIRNPNPVETQVYNQAVAPGESWTTEFAKIGMLGTQSATVEFSAMPSINLENRMSYLMSYPYGCIEQTTSKAFPQLVIEDIRDLSVEERQAIKKNVNGGIRRIAKMQLSNGGFSYWPGSSRSDEWGSSYAGHFLLKAKEKGYHISSQLMSGWERYQSDRAKRFRITKSRNLWHQQSQMRNQAYRLMTLSMYGSPQLSAMNVLRQEINLPNTAQYMLATAYAYAGKKEIAIELIRNTKSTVEPYKELSFTYGSNLRDMALIAGCMKHLDRSNEGLQIIKRIAEELNSNKWHSTQTVAQALIAVADYTGQEQDKGMEFTFDIASSELQSISTSKSMFTYSFDPDKELDLSCSVVNKGGSTLFIKASISGQEAPQKVLEGKAYNKNISLSVSYEDLNGKYLDPKSLSRGTDFIAHVTIRNQKSRGETIENLALTQIFPSGWEIQSGGLSNVSSAIKEDSYDYRDVRDDRVHTFFTLKDRKDFKILLTAAYDGTYFLPAVSCEAMYDNEIQSRTVAQQVEVVAP